MICIVKNVFTFTFTENCTKQTNIFCTYISVQRLVYQQRPRIPLYFAFRSYRFFRSTVQSAFSVAIIDDLWISFLTITIFSRKMRFTLMYFYLPTNYRLFNTLHYNTSLLMSSLLMSGKDGRLNLNFSLFIFCKEFSPENKNY